jgi:hypothetical protein
LHIALGAVVKEGPFHLKHAGQVFPAPN